MYETDWSYPNPAAFLDPAGPPLADTEPLVTREPAPDTDSVLLEVAALYPVVAYPEQQESDDGDDELERTIYAGIVNN